MSPASTRPESPERAGTPRERRRRSPKQWLHDLSLTTRLVAVVVAFTLLAFVVTTALTVALMRDYLVGRVDADLAVAMRPLGETAVDQLITSAEQPAEDIVLVSAQTFHLQVTLTADGTYTRHFPYSRAGLDQPELGVVTPDDERLHQPFTSPGRERSSQNWRTLIWPVTQDGQKIGTMALSTPLSRVDSTVSQMVLLITVVGFCVIVTVALLSWFAVRRAFRPLSRIEDTAKAIAGGDLTRRIPERRGKDEVASLSTSLNTMLARIEQAFAVRAASEGRMRQFVADASHELRTPLATVRGYAELYRVGGIQKEADVASAMRRVENEATRMTRLVEDLLLLTRLDSQREMQRSVIDLTVLVADTVQDARVRAPQRTIRMLWPQGHSGPIRTAGDDHSLRQVLANLVGNALSHTPEESDVEVALAPLGRTVMIEVRDHGAGIPADLAPRVFERFFRADPSRSRENGGTGLGLAIVAAIVGHHGGRVSHHDTPGGGATFRVELPALRPVVTKKSTSSAPSSAKSQERPSDLEE